MNFQELKTKVKKDRATKDTPKCACGCNGFVISDRKGQWNKFIHGHNSKVMSEETKKKISRTRKGKRFSRKHRLKLSKAQKGRKLSKEHKFKISLAVMKCRTDGYCDQWSDKQYKDDLKQKVCSHCGLTEKESLIKYSIKLYLHHKDENKNNCHPGNIDTLCSSCHCKEHWRLGSYDNRCKI